MVVTRAPAPIHYARKQRHSTHHAKLGLFAHNFSGVEFNKHSRIRLQVFHGDCESKVVQYEELDLEMVQLCQGKSANLKNQLLAKR